MGLSEMRLRSLDYEELHSLYRSPNILWVIKSRRLRWAGNVARLEEIMRAFKILCGIEPPGSISHGVS